ncbi:glycosidase [Hypnocyclicus thermotrophus]|uniref:Alpha-amylase n=1 Tax=Hypnocyclicus thermotrophus TaxID=1627895 RepID=A0AA46E0I8_9FUSO|nr:alpha-amylase family glycosyl hydrolase [Hypnocyclicus thermotrophus]TDT72258.1 glycosidase [Hypnocyclicus thermotrophus]
MKKLVYLIMILLFVSCSNLEKVSDNYKENVFDLENYIELDNHKVNFLFEVPENSEIEFYLAKDGEKLKKVKLENNYSKKSGIVIDGFEPGNIYNYKIIAKINGKKYYTDVFKLAKKEVKLEKSRATWAKNAVFYEVFVRSFYDSNGDKIGDFKGLAQQLDYIKNLGIDAIWLMPTFESPSYHGYDIVDYYNVEKDYGSIEDFKYLIKKAHQKNIKIILDLVLNHTSSRHPWFRDAISNPNSKYRDYYVWASKYDNIKEKGEWGQNLWYKKRNAYYQAVFWNEMPDLNYRNPKVREEAKKIAKYWLDMGVDGFRLDAAKHIDSEYDEVNHKWWQEFTAYVKSINKEAFIVGENWDENENVVAKYMEDMDASFNFKISKKLTDFVQRKNFDLIKEVLRIREKYSKYNKNFIDATFVRNHDMNRIASEVWGDKEKQKLIFSLLFTIPGTPFIYYGEELGQLGKKPDENIREPFDWYKSAKGPGMTKAPSNYSGLVYTKANDGISLEEEYNDENSIYNYIKELIKLRKEYPIFNDGIYKTIELNRNIYAYTISKDDVELLIIHNLNKKQTKFILPKEYQKYGINIELSKYETKIIKK